jgi:hypothetical protein
MEASMTTKDFDSADLKNIQYDANIRINFLENRLLDGNINLLKKALNKFTAVFNQYNFHAIARLLQGYLYIKLGDTAEGERIFKDVSDMLENESISKAYYKYIAWDTPATNSYRQWLKNRG